MTIKERAKSYSDLCDRCIQSNGCPNYGCVECEKRGEYNGYLQGAEDRTEEICEKVELALKELGMGDDTINGFLQKIRN